VKQFIIYLNKNRKFIIEKVKRKKIYRLIKYLYNFFRKFKKNTVDIKITLLSCKKFKNIIKDSYLNLYYDLFVLISKQYKKDYFNRMDIIVRYLFIENYFGNNNYGYNLYRKMQKKRVNKNNTSKNFEGLIDSFKSSGFQNNSVIILDQNLQLIDGSHRLACALYFNINSVPIKIQFSNRPIFYGINWFLANGFSRREINLINAKKEELFRKFGLFFVVILWPPIKNYFEELTSNIGSEFKIISISDYAFDNNYEFNAVVKGIYACDDIADWKIQKKIEAINHNTYDKEIRLICIEIDNPKYRIKDISGNAISVVAEKIKEKYREKYKKKIKSYYYDILLHVGDNYEHSRHMLDIFNKDIDIFSFLDSIKNYRYALTKIDVPYMTKKFPYDYPLSKDLDIICDKKCFSDICLAAKLFSSKYKNKYVIKFIESDSRLKIRFELNNFLCYQLDIQCEINCVDNLFIKNALDERKKRDGFYYFSEEYETFIRLIEYVKNKQKKHHLEYLRQHQDALELVVSKYKYFFKKNKTVNESRLFEELKS
jgi:hypothetical protein